MRHPCHPTAPYGSPVRPAQGTGSDGARKYRRLRGRQRSPSLNGGSDRVPSRKVLSLPCMDQGHQRRTQNQAPIIGKASLGWSQSINHLEHALGPTSEYLHALLRADRPCVHVAHARPAGEDHLDGLRLRHPRDSLASFLPCTATYLSDVPLDNDTASVIPTFLATATAPRVLATCVCELFC